MTHRRGNRTSGDQSTTRQCIYCLRQLEVSEFNVEHVLSEAFGKFIQPLKLHDCVCRECNQFFGDQLELRFARGAFEGMLRYHKGVKAPPAGKVRLSYVEFAIPDGNEWAGVRLQVANGFEGLRFTVVPQVGFFDQDSGTWAYATHEEIAEFLIRRPEVKKGQIRVFAPSQQDHA